MVIRSILFVCLLFVANVSHAQFHHNTDYYFDRSDAMLRQQLAEVEKHHLGPCMQGYQEHHYVQAYQDCEFMLNYFPNHPRALLLMAQICEAWKNPHCNSEPFFERAIEINPEVSGTYSVVGIYQLRLKKVPEAIGSLKKAVELDQNSINGHYNLALAYFESKQYELSNQHAQLAYQLGAPLPGLREKLKKAGQWNPSEPQSGGRSQDTRSQK